MNHIPNFIIYFTATVSAFFLTMFGAYHTRKKGKRYLVSSIAFAVITGSLMLINDISPSLTHGDLNRNSNQDLAKLLDSILHKEISPKQTFKKQSSKSIPQKDKSHISVGSNNVVSINQQGGVTAGTVNINSSVPRLIPKDKYELLKTDISQHPNEGIDINCLLSDEETFIFASQLKTLFQSSGWKIDGVNRCMYSVPIKGLIIAIKDSLAIPKGNYVFQLLQFAGFDAHGEIRSDIKYPVGIIVGSK
jgi:hypothetical protein